MGEIVDPTERTLHEIAEALDAGQTSSSELVATYQKRIAALNRSGPCINAVNSLAEDAHDIALALDRERAERGPRTPLHGVPILVKDNIDVAGLATTAGSIALAGCRPTQDADVVAALKRVGAIILGKTNMSEFAMSNGRPGYGSFAGQTANPHDPSRDASGSSSGSAAAIAAGFAAAALGTDTFGSIRGPASVTGLAALRPTQGLISCDGIVPLSAEFDTVGPMARSVEDLALLFGAMIGSPMSSAGLGRDLKPGSLPGIRLGSVIGLSSAHPDVSAMMEEASIALRNAGVAIEPVALPTGLDELLSEVLSPLAAGHFMVGLSRYLAASPEGTPQSVEKLLDALDHHNALGSGYGVNPVTLAVLRQAAGWKEMPDQQAAFLQDRLEAFRTTICGWFADGIDALLIPTHLGPARPRFDQPDARPSYTANPISPSYLATAAGLPEVTLPARKCRMGLPLGLSLVGAPFSEQKLFGLALSCQRIIRQASENIV
jgi:amidase